MNEGEKDFKVPVIRHGQFEGPGLEDYNYEVFRESLSEKSRGYPLTEKGVAEIEKAVDEMPDVDKVNLIFASEYERSVQTAEVIARRIKEKFGKDVTISLTNLASTIEMPVDVLSREEFEVLYDKGGNNAVAEAVFQKWASGQYGESPEKVQIRIEKFLKLLRRTMKQTSARKVMVVTHSSFGNAVQRYLVRQSQTADRDKGTILGTGGYYILDLDTSKDEFDIETFPGKFLE